MKRGGKKMLYELVAYGIAQGTAEKVVSLINAGLTVGSIISILGGVTVGLSGVFTAVKAAIAKQGIKKAIQL